MRLLILKFDEIDSLYLVLKNDVLSTNRDYKPLSDYTVQNPRIIAQLLFWSSEFHKLLRKYEQ